MIGNKLLGNKLHMQRFLENPTTYLCHSLERCMEYLRAMHEFIHWTLSKTGNGVSWIDEDKEPWPSLTTDCWTDDDWWCKRGFKFFKQTHIQAFHLKSVLKSSSFSWFHDFLNIQFCLYVMFKSWFISYLTQVKWNKCLGFQGL